MKKWNCLTLNNDESLHLVVSQKFFHIYKEWRYPNIINVSQMIFNYIKYKGTKFLHVGITNVSFKVYKV